MLAKGFQDRPADPYILDLEGDWGRWLRTLFPRYVSRPDGTPVPFAAHHEDLWRWIWAMPPNERPDAFFGLWARGGAKSTSAEMGTVALGALGKRRYGWYVSETHDQAADHLSNIANMLESPVVAQHYPDLADRALGKYGSVKAWRRQRFWTAGGFVVDALGLDVAARGAKLEEQRPDFMVFDDIDGEADTLDTTEKKVRTITRKLLPAGAFNLAVLGIQNVVIPTGVFAKIADGTADFLRRRIVSGPIPAVYDLEYEDAGEDGYRITGGTPSWAGQDLDICEEQMAEWGLSAFLVEAQHQVEQRPGGMFSHLTYRHCTWDEVPWDSLVAVTVWLDPAVTDKHSSDAQGIHADGLADDYKTIYRLYSWEQRATPLEAMRRALRKAVELRAATVGVETDQGGDTWLSVYREAWRSLVQEGLIPSDTPRPRFLQAKAGQGEGPKTHRANQMLAEYERGRFVHVYGTHDTLEKALFRFPKTKPLDLVDCAFWSWRYLNDFRKPDRHASRPVVMGGGVEVGGRDRLRAPQGAGVRRSRVVTMG